MSTRLKTKVSQWLNAAQYWLLPGICIVCRKNSGRPFDLCPGCEATFAGITAPCRGCALPLPPGDHHSQLCGPCLRPRRSVQATVAGFAYADPVRRLVSQFKYQGKLQHGRVLTTLLERRVRLYYDGLPLPELLIPVPLHRARLRERGFNQALLMASHLGPRLAIPVAPQLLLRQRQTLAQQGLSARERKHNLRGAFCLAAGADLRQVRSLALIDDVVTTMSTVTELARLLRRHGSEPLAVHVWCLARA